MPVRPSTIILAGAIALAGTLTSGAPVFAQPSPLPPPPSGVVDAEGRVYGDAAPVVIAAPPPPMAPAYVPPYTGQPGGDQTAYAQPRYDRAEWEAAQARADWLAECRRRHGNGNMVGGAIVGGVAGGLLGNAVAGRHDKTLGTVAGAVAGAAAGGAIGHGADTRRSRDYCESYLDRYTRAGYGYGQPGYGYGYAYQPMMVMVPVMMAQPVAAPAAPRRYTETTQVIEEWVPVTTPHRRYIPPRKRVAPPAKRIRVVPDKRVPL